MTAALTAFAALTSVLLPLPRPAPSGVLLEYRRPLGQVAEYRLHLAVSGSQTSLGESRPVQLRAEVAITEEVIAHEKGGILWLRVRARPVSVRDPSGTFSSAARAAWPEFQLRATRRGEVIEATSAVSGHSPGPPERAFSSLMMQPATVVLPSGPVEVGATWEWGDNGAYQRSRLVAVDGEGTTAVARIASEGRVPIELHERSAALGLTTEVSGEQTQTSELDLLPGQGLVARHSGKMRLEAKSEVALALAEGRQDFTMSSKLDIDFDLRLVRVDAKPFTLPG